MASLTRARRDKVVAGVDFQWSGKSWVHNIFRFYELIFWRRFGIRPELSSAHYHDKNGKQIVVYQFHTFEAVCAHIEAWIRGAFKFQLPVKIWIPHFSTTDGLPQAGLPFLFSISQDANSVIAAATTASPATWNHTCTGSNLLIAMQAETNKTTTPVTAMKYNTVAGTKVTGASAVDGTNGITVDNYYLLAPATGSNQVSITWTTGSSVNLIGGAISFSGVQQSGVPDASGTASGAVGAGNSNQPSKAITTVADNCFGIACVGVNDNSALTQGASQTKSWEVDESGSPFHTGAGSYRGPQHPAGSMTMNFTGAVNGDNWVIGVYSIAPAAAATSPVGNIIYINQARNRASTY